MCRLTTALLLIFTLSACQTSSKVTTDYDTNTAFNQYKTFRWSTVEVAPSSEVDPLVLERVRDALEIQLLLAGLNPSKPEQSADLIAAYRVSMKENPVNNGPNTSVGIGHGRGSYGSSTGISIGFSFGNGSSNNDANIIVELIDPQNNEIKWSGSKPVGLAGKSPSEISDTVNSAIEEIIRFYPPN